MKKPSFNFWDWLFGRIPKSVKISCQACAYEDSFVTGIEGFEVVKISEGEHLIRRIPKPPKQCPKCGSSNLKTSPGPPLIC